MKHKPAQIVAKLRQVDVLVSQGRSAAEAVRSTGVTQLTYSRTSREFGGPETDQVQRLEELENKNERLRGAVSDPTPEKLAPKEAAQGNFWVPPTAASLVGTGPRSARCGVAGPTRLR